MSDDVKKRQEEKLKFEVGYLGDVVINSMAYLDLTKDERVSGLYKLLEKVNREVQRLKQNDFKLAKRMNSGTRERILEVLVETEAGMIMDCNSREIADMLRDGILGFKHMSDEELLNELVMSCGFDEGAATDDDDPMWRLVQEAKIEMEIDTALNK